MSQAMVKTNLSTLPSLEPVTGSTQHAPILWTIVCVVTINMVNVHLAWMNGNESAFFTAIHLNDLIVMRGSIRIPA